MDGSPANLRDYARLKEAEEAAIRDLALIDLLVKLQWWSLSCMVAGVLENRHDVVNVSGVEQRRLHRNQLTQFVALLGV